MQESIKNFVRDFVNLPPLIKNAILSIILFTILTAVIIYLIKFLFKRK